MNSTSNYLNFSLQAPLLPSTPLSPLEYRVWRRTRLKIKQNKLVVSCSFDNVIKSLNSLELIVPALGLASGSVALYLSRLKSNQNSNSNSNSNSNLSHIGEWILFTSPNPFYRFVLLRCASITFEGSELSEDLSEKLVKEERHSGKIRVKDLVVRDDEFEENFVYQRVCVSTDDGGVISLDWPSKLDLNEEHGMDTTVLLVPGTPEGSMDKYVRAFVCDLQKRGCFPVVMNPRGCAGSPLTTARLFTGADSDDICTAIQFVNRARPWSTMMAVGWGHGANMLTKYLAEVAENTPLTAATCIDNPFDLEEATRSFPYHVSVDQKLTSGLVDILRSNKELFQGREKGFHVDKALAATSLRDFEREVSMVSYGFETIEEFYVKSSTRELVGNVKIPLLFIQSDDGTVPPFSIPRSSITENAFTSLLLCSCLPSTNVTSEKSVLLWCQHLAIEWLTAVELGFLKGRHPLLNDVDVTINPSAGLALVDSKASTKNSGANKLLNVTEMDPSVGYSIDSIVIDTTDNVQSRNLFEGGESPEMENYKMSDQSGLDGTGAFEETGEELADTERGQVLQSAQLVMNMLDATMPGTLEEEQKKKVLTAVEQGETFMKALEGAVPEDVRGKLTTSVSEIVKTHGTNLDLRRIMNISLVPGASSDIKTKVLSATEGFLSQEQIKSADEMPGGTDKQNLNMEKPHQEPESYNRPSEALEKSSAESQVSGSEESNESVQIQDQEEISRQKTPDFYADDESGPGTESSLNKHDRAEKADDSDAFISEQEKIVQGDDRTQMISKEDNGVQITENTSMDVLDDQNKSRSTGNLQHPKKAEDSNLQPMEDQNKQGSSESEDPSPAILPTSNPPDFNVSQAFDALTGLDDSTQVAVNSVFGVLEGMIAKLEENGKEIDGRQDKSKDPEQTASEDPSITSETEAVSRNKANMKRGSSLESNPSQYRHGVEDHRDKCIDLQQDLRNNLVEIQHTQNQITSLNKNRGSLNGSSLGYHVGSKKENSKNDVNGSTLSEKTPDKVGHISKYPLYVTGNPYGESMYNEYLRRYLLSKIPHTKSLDLDSTADLLLDYFPEEGQWMLLDQTENNRDPDGNNGRVQDIHSPPHGSDVSDIIETSYVVLDKGKQQQPIEEYKTEYALDNKPEEEELRSKFFCSVKNVILDSLKVEVGRKLGFSDLKEMEPELALELEHVAGVVSLAVKHGKELTKSRDYGSALGEVGPLHGEEIIQSLSLAINSTIFLKKVLPVGVIVGSSLAALKTHFSVATQHDSGYGSGTFGDHADNVVNELEGEASETRNNHEIISRKHQDSNIDSSVKAIEKSEPVYNDSVMVGAVTAALGASALLAHQRNKGSQSRDESVEVSSRSVCENQNHPEEDERSLAATAENDQNPIISNLTEKAMSVAGPVVPTKSDGGLDQERLVAMLSDLGQKGGMLRMIGKVALLWGGIRGAVSLTDRLISFLRIADRPLFQRLLGFVCMVLVLWSPVVIPLFPTLVQGWATHNSTGIAEYVCLIGLYTAVMILVILWGKRIRGHEDPLKQYGFDLKSTKKLLDFLKGLMGGVMLVLSVHSTNVLLGCAHFSWSSVIPVSSPHATLLKACGKFLLLAGRGFATATVVVIVEEILFRSWLPQEISVEFGYHRAIIISGFAFSILQRSVHSIPGLWLLSIALSGLRERNEGSLSMPIGMRAGILSASFILQTGGFLIYESNYPLWLAGAHPLQPFDGAVGLAFCIMLSMLLYPKQPLGTKKIETTIHE